ncbi:glutamate receptor-interacting protein 2-like isoform X1 [Lytechinus variegatus]|uniref:glutamate receptor-interacting protein 2-like isoform X1 n=1 Tax=Lytechinus variegatus TaxID=7654 RepID=UPI001BB0E47D|nr:glutamate receptor-interacting protein 2-like isoform X1 [Lytechinus variegatus]XP_041459237.1 glutamate receptor-interacting protein 2-like isoform X1 [Lytechinus variegatus]XP_041459238.1 glutamate receptor-interacting protein 2-like isoform X1 [Lytechinus variegatus]
MPLRMKKGWNWRTTKLSLWMLDILRMDDDDSRKGKAKTSQELALQNEVSTIPEEVRAYSIVELEKSPGVGFGLTISGGIDKDGRPRVTNMRPGGVAHRSDVLQTGDFITAVNNVKTATLRHDEVITLLKNAGNKVSLEIEYELPGYAPMSPSTGYSKTLDVRLTREDGSYGFTIRGGVNATSSKTRPLVVTHIRPGGPSDREGSLKVGDRLVAVETTNLSQASHMEALNIIRQGGNTAVLRFEYDVSIMEAVKNATGPLLVEVSKTPGAHLGVGLSSIPRNGKSVIIIDNLKPASIADRCGALHVGDEILTIDGLTTTHMGVAEAMKLLASGTEQVKLEILPVSQMTPRLTYHRDMQKMGGQASRSTTPLMPGYSHSSLSRVGTMNSQNTRQQSSTLARKLRSKGHKTGSMLSLASTINGLSSPQVCHTDTVEVTLYSRTGDYGIQLQSGVFATEILGSPAVVGFVEPGGKAEKSGVMQAGDRLIAINGSYTEDMTADEANHILRESAPQVTLEIEFDIAESVVPSSGVFNVKLPVSEMGLGITLTSLKHRKLGDGLLISTVKKGSVANRSGTLEPGDQVLAIDDIHLDSITVEEAMHLLAQADEIVKLKVKKNEAYSDEPDVSGAISYSVELVRHGGPLGITISGTEEPFDPVIISGLTENGLAERTGAIHLGDRLLAINGVSLKGKTLSEAIRLLQSAGDTVVLKISKKEKHRGHEQGNKPSSRSQSPSRFGRGTAHYDADHIATPVMIQTNGDSWEGSGMDTGYHSNHTHHSRSHSPKTSRSRRSSMSPSRRSNRPRRVHNSSHSTSPNDASEDELDERRRAFVNGGNGPYPVDILSSDQDDSYAHSQHSYHPHEAQIAKHREFLRQLEASFLNTDQFTSSEMRRAGSVGHGYYPNQPSTIGGRKPSTSSLQMYSDSSHSYTLPPHAPTSGGGYNQFESFSSKSESVNTTHQNALNQNDASHLGDESTVSDPPNAAPVELHKVSLMKDSDVEDFGFSVSDGISDKGVFVNTVRPGGPASRSGNVKPFDRILQINQTRTHDFDCCMVVPLITDSGNKLELVVSRNPLAKQQNGEDEGSWSGVENGHFVQMQPAAAAQF